MAAIDVIYNTETPVLFTPDYSFLRYALDKKQARYDQGLEAVSKAYNNLKREVTDPVNGQRRDQFLKDAEGQLKKIASSDLSLSQNINAANNVFDPLATNPAFLIDAYTTKRVKEANETMNMWANSSDPELRKRYSSEIQRWVNRDLDVLREGKGDVNNYKKIQNRQAFAYLDPQDILNDAAKESGFQFKIDTAGQPYIVTTEGGKAGVPSYQEFSKAVLGSNQAYQRQLQVLGEARSEDVLDLYKNKPEWQGKTDQEKLIDYGVITRETHRKNQQTYLDGLEKNLNKEDADIRAYFNANQDVLKQGQNDIASGNNGTPAAQTFTEFQTRASNRNSLKTQLGERKSLFDQTYGSNAPDDLTFAKNFASNPRKFFSDQQLENDVQTFTNIKASSVVRKITPDSAYVSLENAKLTAMKNTWNMMDDMQDNLTDQQKIDLQEAKLAMQGKKLEKNADGTTRVVDGKGAEITVGSASATQLYMINALEKLKERVTIAKSNSIQSMTGATGALSILPSFGLPNDEVAKVKSLYLKQLNAADPTKAIGLTADDKKTLQNFYSKAIAFAKNAGIDFDQNAYTQLTVKDIPFILQKAMAGYTPKNMNEVSAMRAMEDYNHNSDIVYQAGVALEKGKQAIASTYDDPKKHPEFVGMFTKKNGVSNLIDKEDITKMISPFLKGSDLESAVSDYLNGGSNIKIDPGRWYGYQKSQWYPGSTTFNVNGKSIEIQNGDIFGKITPKKYQELTKKINTEIPIPNYMNEQGMMLSNPRFLLTGKTAAKMALELSDPTQSNANIFEYSEGTAEATQVEENQTIVRNAMKDDKNIAGVTVYSASPLNKAGMAVAVTMTDSKSDKKQPWEGRTYYFPINVNETSPEILRIFGQVNEVGEFEQYKKEGKDFVINTFQGTGIKAVVHPNMAGDNTGTIEVMHKPWDPKTKTYGDWEPIDPMNPSTVFDLNQITFPEIKESVYQKVIYPYVEQYIRRQKEKAASTAVTDKPISLESFLK